MPIQKVAASFMDTPKFHMGLFIFFMPNFSAKIADGTPCQKCWLQMLFLNADEYTPELTGGFC